MSEKTTFNTITNPCIEGIPEHVAMRQCYFCDMLAEKQGDIFCTVDNQEQYSKLPHECINFIHEHNKNVYKIVRKSDFCARCGKNIGFKVPVDNGVIICGEKITPICGFCREALKEWIKG